LWVQKRPVAEVEKGRLLRLQSALSALKPQPLLTLLDLVSAHKQLQTLGVLSADVAPDAANIHVITGGGIQRGGEAVLGPTHTRTAAKAHTAAADDDDWGQHKYTHGRILRLRTTTCNNSD
jgi:hypothetical protein